jgi:phospholipase C
MAVSATIDPAGAKGGPSLSTVFDAAGLKGDFRWTTMPEQLQARKISWKSYTEAVGQFDNPFPAFRQFRDNPKLSALGIQPTYPNDFTTDLKNDKLPAVSWIQLSFLNSEHAANPPGKGEAGVDNFLRLLWKYPKIWKKTAVIINYDENGGFFDHVAPPVAPKGTKGEYLTMSTLPPQAGGVRGPIGLGFRVPCLIVSPWTRGGFVSSDVFDHTSVLKLIEKRFGAEVPNLSSWRRKTVGDLTSAFNFAAKPDFSIPTNQPPTSLTAPVVTTEQCAPGTGDPPPYPVPSSITFPKQKSGKAKRPSGIV